MASSDYISREAAESALKQPVTMSMCLTLEECKQKNAQRQIDLFVIRGLPAADVRPVVRKPVVGYEGLYFVSDDGEVTNADGMVIKQSVKNGCGTCYKRVSLDRCPLRPVQPHGRLIDADALSELAYQRQKEMGIACCIDALDIALAPTIIPAEPCNNLSKPCKEGET